MISKHVRGPDDERAANDGRNRVERDDARRVAERHAQNQHDRRLASESGVPYVVPNGIDRDPEDRDVAR